MAACWEVGANAAAESREVRAKILVLVSSSGVYTNLDNYHRMDTTFGHLAYVLISPAVDGGDYEVVNCRKRGKKMLIAHERWRLTFWMAISTVLLKGGFIYVVISSNRV